MNEPEKRDQSQDDISNSSLEAQIAQTLRARAALVHFSPLLRAQTIQRLSAHRSPAPIRRFRFALAVALLLILLGALGVSFFKLLQPGSSPETIAHLNFTNDGTLATPPQLAQGGQLLSLDPTAHSIVYSIPGQSGVMYTTTLAAPLLQNELAMRYAREISWAPDGSELVTTIYPAATDGPQLALVPTGHYMHLLNLAAQAAAWLPSSNTVITFLTQTHNAATLWETTPQGGSAHVMTTLLLPALAQRLSWSPDGQFLAILATRAETLSRDLLQGASNELYLFNVHNQTLSELVIPAQFSLGSLAWSPNGHLFTYEQVSPQNRSTLYTLDPSTQQIRFTLELQQRLLGMSWSPNSQILIYSDGGVLHAHALNGAQAHFPGVAGMATSPFWLDSHHVLYLSITRHLGQLARLAIPS